MKLLVIGATGLVGSEVVKLLNFSNIKIDKICFIASLESRNKLIKFREKTYMLKTVNDIKFSDFTHALTLTSSEVSKQIIPSLLFNNLIVIDNSSAYRKHHYLTIPKLNFIKNKRLYINPNCCVIQSVSPLFYINKKFNIKKIIYNTYQSCSGGGYKLLSEFNDKKINDCIPFIGEYYDNSDTEEEVKLINESKKILNKNIDIFANCVRVPVGVGHLVNITITVDNSTINDIFEILNEHTIYQSKLEDISIKDNCNIYTTRLKLLENNTYSFYSYANNLLVGAAYNTFSTLNKIIEND